MEGEKLGATERALAGDSLAAVGDDRFDTEVLCLPAEQDMDWVEVPAGTFLMGSGPKDGSKIERPQHTIDLPRYYMARYPVTVDQFAVFVSATGHDAHPRSLQSPGNRPVTIVSWFDALAYCRWLNGELCSLASDRLEKPLWRAIASGELVACLPSEAEWEKAARGTKGQTFPWAGVFDPERANTYESGIGETSAVGCYAHWPSPGRCLDMAGNVWEWTRSIWGEDWQKPSFHYPYAAADGREDFEAPGSVLRVLRGGSFAFERQLARCAARFRSNPEDRDLNVGFRVALSPSL